MAYTQQIPRKLTSGKVMPFGFYIDKALHFTSPPNDPTWLYTMSKGFGQGVSLRSIVWFACLAPTARLLWMMASSGTHLVVLTNVRVILMVNLVAFVFMVAINVLAPWPAKEDSQPMDAQHVNDPSYLARIGCVVPCHKSAEEITATLRSLLRFLRPEHIVVVDNGNSPEPLDETQRMVQDLHPGITYVWVPVGMKTNALWVGLSKLPPSVEYVMHIDDDTECPPDMVFDEQVWDDSSTDAVSYGIVMYQTGIVEKMVDLEFKIISQLRLFQSKYSTVWFQHGIIGIWRRQAFTDVLKEHPFLPFGEDNWNGTINLLRNRQMRQELRSCVRTYAPPTLFPGGPSDRQQGYGAANLWKQRAERWFVNAPRRFFIRLYLLFFYQHTTLTGNVVFRLLSLAHLFEIYVHLQAPVTVVAYACSDQLSLEFVAKAICLQYCLTWFHTMVQNYFFWSHRDDIQVDFKVVCLQPFYHWLLNVMFWYGHWRCLLYYIPFVPMRHGLYTEGGMTPALLKHLHGIDTVEDISDAETSSRCGLSEGSESKDTDPDTGLYLDLEKEEGLPFAPHVGASRPLLSSVDCTAESAGHCG